MADFTFWFIRASANTKTMSRRTTAIRRWFVPKPPPSPPPRSLRWRNAPLRPKFKKQFPEAAALYLKKAKAGLGFLERAIAKHGKDGAYQKITHYGNEFMHDDELAWAACEMFLATGEARLS